MTVHSLEGQDGNSVRSGEKTICRRNSQDKGGDNLIDTKVHTQAHNILGSGQKGSTRILDSSRRDWPGHTRQRIHSLEPDSAWSYVAFDAVTPRRP